MAKGRTEGTVNWDEVGQILNGAIAAQKAKYEVPEIDEEGRYTGQMWDSRVTDPNQPDPEVMRQYMANLEAKYPGKFKLSAGYNFYGEEDEGLSTLNRVGISAAAAGDAAVNTGKRLLNMFAQSGTADKFLNQPDQKSEPPFDTSPTLAETMNDLLRASGSMGQNVGAGIMGMWPYLVPVAGQALFAADVATQPGQIPEMVGQIGGSIKTLWDAGLIPGNPNAFTPTPEREAALEELRQRPIETLVNAGLPVAIATGIGSKIKGGKSPRVALREYLEPEIIEKPVKPSGPLLLPAPEGYTAGEYPGVFVKDPAGRIIEVPATKVKGEAGHYVFNPSTVQDWLTLKQRAKSGELLTQMEKGKLFAYELRFDKEWKSIWGNEVNKLALSMEVKGKVASKKALKQRIVEEQEPIPISESAVYVKTSKRSGRPIFTMRPIPEGATPAQAMAHYREALKIAKDGGGRLYFGPGFEGTQLFADLNGKGLVSAKSTKEGGYYALDPEARVRATLKAKKQAEKEAVSRETLRKAVQDVSAQKGKVEVRGGEEHLRDNALVQEEGVNRNVPPEVEQGRTETGGGDLFAEGGKVPTEEIAPAVEQPKILKTLDKMEAAAKKRLEDRAKKMGTTLSANPLPELTGALGDMAVIGAAKIARGTVEFAKWSAEMVAEFGEKIRPELQRLYNHAILISKAAAKEDVKANLTRKAAVGKGPAIDITLSSKGKVEIGGDISQVKDIGPSTAYTRDNFRNMERAFGEKADDVIVKPLLEAKNNTIDFQLENLAEYNRTVEKGLGIKPHTPADRAVMALGEGQLTVADVVKQFGQAKADQIVAAEKWYRQKYDLFLDQANAVAEKIYPGQSDKQIPKRKDYFRHYKELGGVRDIIANFENPADVPTGMSRAGDFMKPKSKTLGFMRRRLGSKSGESAAAGYANYIQGVSYAIHINPMVARLRSFADALTKATEKSGNLNRTTLAVNRWADNLSGMINPIDKPFIELGGERAMNFANSVGGRMRSNAILGNVSALVGQLGNIPNAIGKAGPRNSVLGLKDAVASVFLKNKAIEQSAFLKERYSNTAFNKFELSWVGEKTHLYTRPYSKQTAVWLMNTVNRCADYFTWSSMYRKAINERVSNPIMMADKWTREMVAGRGIGEIPIVMQSRVLRLIAPFQVEVGNAAWVLRDMVGNKQVGALITFAVASYIFNEFARNIRGSQVSFDPVNAVKDAVTIASDPDIPTEKKLYQVPGRIAGEVFSNLPFGQSISSNIMTDDMRKKFFGSQDPSRFGTGAFITQGLQKPLTTIVPPFGGKQIEKTVGGIRAANEKEVKSKAGNTLFQTGGTVESQVRNVIFGRWSTPEARKYFDGSKDSDAQVVAREKQRVADSIAVANPSLALKKAVQKELERLKTKEKNAAKLKKEADAIRARQSGTTAAPSTKKDSRQTEALRKRIQEMQSGARP
ncbi:MAG: hypothetical protein WC356_04230 [Candidatus Micrarchaeia archaeon]|jgi:hypothetical protein